MDTTLPLHVMSVQRSAVMSGNEDRALTARSVLASALLGLEPPEMTVAQLIAMTSLFDINANRSRVALSRMVSAGEVSTDGNGRYRLEGDLLARQARQRLSRRGPTRVWRGRWIIVIATETLGGAAARTERRRAFERARLGELREGAWMRPDNIDVVVDNSASGEVERLIGQPIADAEALAARLWDVAGWSRGAARLMGRLDVTEPDGESALASGFVLSASILRHLQADPMLPPPLLPTNWIGAELRATYDGWDRRYRAHLTAWSRAVRVR